MRTAIAAAALIFLRALAAASALGELRDLSAGNSLAAVISPEASPASRPTVSYGIRIEGPDDFTQETTRALTLLGKSGDLSEVTRYVRAIRRSRCSGMDVVAQAFDVGDPTWKAGTLWYASTIAHDSRHERLYQEALAARKGKGRPEDSAFSGAEAEKKCLAFQLEVLQRLGADAKTLAYVRELTKNPTYQNIGAQSGVHAQDVCDKRKW